MQSRGSSDKPLTPFFFFLLQAILEILLRGEQLGEDVHLDQIAKDTDGFSGSDLKRMLFFLIIYFFLIVKKVSRMVY